MQDEIEDPHVYREVASLYAINQAAADGCVVVTAHYDSRGYWVALMLEPPSSLVKAGLLLRPDTHSVGADI